jgi:hypothetical protein
LPGTRSSGIDRRLGLDAGLLHVAVRERDVNLLGLSARGGRGLVGVGDQRTIDDAPLRRAGAGALRESLEQACRAALRGGRVGIIANLDRPGAATNRDAGKRRLILRIEPALCGGPGRPCGPQQQHRPRRGEAAPEEE